jgi:alpha-1,3/alpha-1,6-mannosyltransferase
MSILSRLTILCAILRHVHLLLQIAITGELAALRPRAFVVDQLSAGLPLLRRLSPAPVLFYCHFPDLLLARGRESPLKRLYRAPFDRLEEWSMGFARAVAVNSGFTQGVVDATWPRLKNQVVTRVVYPCVDTSEPKANAEGDGEASPFGDGSRVVLSINRFERKKDIGLAIKAFAAIPKSEREGVRLVIAGGYDSRISENVQYHVELQRLADELKLTHHTINTSAVPATSPALADVPPTASVVFLLSVPNALKAALLRAARLLIYTPAGEHFGIVPLEAMLAGVPVLAANTGGPVETVIDGATGWLRDPTDPDAWSAVVRRAIAMPPSEAAAMGRHGMERVKAEFARERMAERLGDIIDEITDPRRTPVAQQSGAFLMALRVLAVLVIGIAMSRLTASNK